MSKPKHASKPTPTPVPRPSPLFKLWNVPKVAGSEPASLVETGDHDEIYAHYLEVSGKNPDSSRAYAMTDAKDVPLYAA